MRIVLLLLLFLSLCGAHCSHQPKLDEDFMYQTLNSIIAEDSLYVPLICSRFAAPVIPDAIQKEFFAGDSSFINVQLKQAHTARVKNSKLFSYDPHKKATTATVVDTACTANMLYSFSYPVFSTDLQTVVISITHIARAMFGSWSTKAVYQKQKGRWVKVREYESWIT